MKLGSFLKVKAAVSLFFGAGMLIMPATLVSLYGLVFDAAATAMMRTAGAMFIGTCVACWYLSAAPESETRQGLILALFVQDTIGFLVWLAGMLGRMAGPLGWVNVVIWLLLALGLGYFRFMQPAS